MPELEKVMATLSLRAQGLLGKPTAPMLVIAGVKYTQVPISDMHLLLDNGDVPKDAWINPNGGHLGRESSELDDPVIFEKIITPWELKMLSPKAAMRVGNPPYVEARMPRVTRIRTGSRRALARSSCATARDVHAAVDPRAASDACQRSGALATRPERQLLAQSGR